MNGNSPFSPPVSSAETFIRGVSGGQRAKERLFDYPVVLIIQSLPRSKNSSTKIERERGRKVALGCGTAPDQEMWDTIKPRLDSELQEVLGKGCSDPREDWRYIPFSSLRAGNLSLPGFDGSPYRTHAPACAKTSYWVSRGLGLTSGKTRRADHRAPILDLKVSRAPCCPKRNTSAARSIITSGPRSCARSLAPDRYHLGSYRE